MVILGVLINETCYKTGRVSTRDFTVTEIFSSSNWIFTACVAYKNQVRTEMEFSYSQTENFEMEKLSSATGYLKEPVEIT